MARPRQPIELTIVKGQKHLTKAEIAERRATEVYPVADEIDAPAYLTAAQARHFDKIARQLVKIRIMGETDVETLARYVIAEAQYETATKEMRALHKDRPKQTDPRFDSKMDYYTELDAWTSAYESSARLQDRFYKQASALARDLGLTISSRCKLAVPKTEEEAPKVNKFAQFGSGEARAQ